MAEIKLRLEVESAQKVISRATALGNNKSGTFISGYINFWTEGYGELPFNEIMFGDILLEIEDLTLALRKRIQRQLSTQDSDKHFRRKCKLQILSDISSPVQLIILDPVPLQLNPETRDVA